MKKVGVILLLVILLSATVSAFSLTDYFSSLFSVQETTITGTQANPIKVYPGQSLQNLVSFEDINGIESAVAYFPFEGGQDKVDMMLIAGNENKGTYSASWVVHDTLNMKWYKTKVILTNSLGTETIAYVNWQDPTQSHPLNQIEPGVSQDAGTNHFLFNSSSTPNLGYVLGATASEVTGVKNNYGLYGYTESTSANSAGILGEGQYTGILGKGPNIGIFGLSTSTTGTAGYFSSGYGVRIDNTLSNNAFNRSSVGNVFVCIEGVTQPTCNIVCADHGLSCKAAMHNTCPTAFAGGDYISCWSTSFCLSACVGQYDGGNTPNGIIACYCN